MWLVQGNWSDNSPLWKQYPKVAKALNHTPSDDGTFWMQWEDFMKYYKCLDFCYRWAGTGGLACLIGGCIFRIRHVHSLEAVHCAACKEFSRRDAGSKTIVAV